MTTTKIYRHPTINISGSRDAWQSLGYQTYNNSDLVVEPAIGERRDGLLLAAIHETSDCGEKALGWAIVERQRRREERTRVTALARQADAIAALAAAIRETDEEAVLTKLLGQLTERTQYAVRAQIQRD